MSDARRFIKMDGTGNDFVVFDARQEPLSLSAEEVRQLAARDNVATQGADQVIVIEPAQNPAADAFMRIYNADGGEVQACGNATRAVGWWLAHVLHQKTVQLQTGAGLLEVSYEGEEVTVDMGLPGLHWKEIPLAEEVDTLHLDVHEGTLFNPVAVGMGNPHMVFFVGNTEEVDFSAGDLGTRLEHHPLFPEGTNVGLVQVVSAAVLRLRVWERGVGETKACGTGACAALVAAHRRGFIGREALVDMHGGTLAITWQGNGHILMCGPVNQQFEGVVDFQAA